MNVSAVAPSHRDDKDRAFSEQLYVLWSDTRDFLHGLRIAWVSVASVVLGALLFVMAPQVQDLFLEVTGDNAKNRSCTSGRSR